MHARVRACAGRLLCTQGACWLGSPGRGDVDRDVADCDKVRACGRRNTHRGCVRRASARSLWRHPPPAPCCPTHPLLPPPLTAHKDARVAVGDAHVAHPAVGHVVQSKAVVPLLQQVGGVGGCTGGARVRACARASGACNTAGGGSSPGRPPACSSSAALPACPPPARPPGHQPLHPTAATHSRQT